MQTSTIYNAVTTSTASIGDGTNQTLFETDGTMVAQGDATCYRDELNDLLKTGLNNPADRVILDLVEGTLNFKSNSALNDWALMNIQVNHDWKLGTAIEPHLHWFQNATQTPNWLIEHRWQKQLSAKTTAWTSVTWSTNAISWSTGVINQITSFGSINAPVGYGQVSDIVQFKLYRDTGNASTLFGAPDAYSGSASTVSFDVHIQVDMMGSRGLYTK
jgi:hypothetical protein